MVILINKLYSKLETHHNHHHHQNTQEALTASLREFQSDVSSFINHILSLNSKPGLEILSLPWIHHCFSVLPMINMAFAKLVANIDYHVEKWEDESIHAYLEYSLNLLDLLNSISSCLSHWTQFRLSLLHAFSLAGSSPPSLAPQQQQTLQAVCSKSVSSYKNFKNQEQNQEHEQERSCSGEEKIVREALREVESATSLVCSIVLCGLSGDAKAYLEMRKLDELRNSSSINLDLFFHKEMKEEGCLLKEAKELNEAAVGKSRGDAEEVKRRLEKFGKQIDEVEKDVDSLFSQVLARRSKLLDSIRKRI